MYSTEDRDRIFNLDAQADKITIIVDHKDGSRSTVTGSFPGIYGYLDVVSEPSRDALAWDDLRPQPAPWIYTQRVEGHIICTLDKIDVLYEQPPKEKVPIRPWDKKRPFRWYHKSGLIMWLLSETFLKLEYLGLAKDDRRIGDRLTFSDLLRSGDD